MCVIAAESAFNRIAAQLCRDFRIYMEEKPTAVWTASAPHSFKTCAHLEFVIDSKRLKTSEAEDCPFTMRFQNTG